MRMVIVGLEPVWGLGRLFPGAEMFALLNEPIAHSVGWAPATVTVIVVAA
jgi:hypothetical protein